MQNTKDGVIIEIIAKPGSREEKLSFDPESENLIVNVKSPPTKGKANKELNRILKELFDQLDYKSIQFEIIRGHTSRKKLILVKNTNIEELRNKFLSHFEFTK